MIGGAVVLLPVDGIGEVADGDDLAELLVTALGEDAQLRDGDVVVVTSKVVSKAEGRVRSLGLDEHFRFLGFRPDAPALIPLFDVVAVPSHVEPLGNATLEAMAAGRPVVGARVGGIPEMVVDGETGLLVAPRAPADLAEALRRLISDPALRARLGAAGAHRARSAFSLEAHVTRLEEVYSTL